MPFCPLFYLAAGQALPLGVLPSYRFALHERQYLALCSSSTDGGAGRMSWHVELQCKVFMQDCIQDIPLHGLLAIKIPQLLQRVQERKS